MNDTTQNMPTADPYAEFGGATLPSSAPPTSQQSAAPQAAVDPYAEFGGAVIPPQAPPQPSQGVFTRAAKFVAGATPVVGPAISYAIDHPETVTGPGTTLGAGIQSAREEWGAVSGLVHGQDVAENATKVANIASGVPEIVGLGREAVQMIPQVGKAIELGTGIPVNDAASAIAKHIVPGSAIEKAMQSIDPDFKAHGEAFLRYEDQLNPLNKPPVDAASQIDKQKHPVLKALAENAQSFLTPESVAVIVGTGGAGVVNTAGKLSVANKLLSVGFAASSIGSAYQHFDAFKEAYDKGDAATAQYELTHAVTSGAMATVLARHAAGAETPLTTPGGLTERAASKGIDVVGNAVKHPVDTAVSVVKSLTPFDALANYVAKGNEEFGVPLSRGQAPDSWAATRAVESDLKKVPIVNRPFGKLASAQSDAINAVANQIISPKVTGEGFDAISLSPADSGQRIQDRLDDADEQNSKGYATALDNLSKSGVAAGSYLDTTKLQTTAQSLVDSLAPAEGYEDAVGSPGRTRAISILQGIIDNVADDGQGPGQMTVGDAIKLRAQLREEISSPTGDIKPYKAVLIKMNNALIDEVKNTLIDEASRDYTWSSKAPNMDPRDASVQFLTAHERYAAVSDALRNKVIKSLRNADPQAVGSMLLSKISPDVVTAITTLNPKALVAVGDGLLQTIFDKVQTKNGGVLTGQDLGKIWDGIDPKVKSGVFGPELPKIQRFVDLVKKLDLQKANKGMSGQQLAGSIAVGAGTATAAGVETGMALAAHAVPPFSALAAGAGFGSYELSKILTGRGGQSFLETLKAAADDTNPDTQAAAVKKLQSMEKPVSPYTKPSSPAPKTEVLRAARS
jgi:hypothetical protein